jgi:pantoate kinase
MKASAFAPGNISGMFQCVEELYSRHPHSLGLSFTIREGVVVTVERAPLHTVRFNGEVLPIPTVTKVVNELSLTPIAVVIETPLSLGFGFGVSGAAALATSLALNTLLELGKSLEELAMCAHRAEVEHLTGLGDVSAQVRGGCVLRTQRGFPLRSSRLNIAPTPLYFKLLSPLSSASVLSNPSTLDAINNAGARSLGKVNALVSGSTTYTFEDLVLLCREFAEESHLIQSTEVRSLLTLLDETNIPCSMIMLGNAVFSSRPFEGANMTMLDHRSASMIVDSNRLSQ